MSSETLPAVCYILSDEYSINFYPTSNGYKNNIKQKRKLTSASRSLYSLAFIIIKFINTSTSTIRYPLLSKRDQREIKICKQQNEIKMRHPPGVDRFNSYGRKSGRGKFFLDQSIAFFLMLCYLFIESSPIGS